MFYVLKHFVPRKHLPYVGATKSAFALHCEDLSTEKKAPFFLATVKHKQAYTITAATPRNTSTPTTLQKVILQAIPWMVLWQDPSSKNWACAQVPKGASSQVDMATVYGNHLVARPGAY